MTTRKRYTKEFKLDAIRLVTEHGCSKAEAARSLGINANMLRRWVKEYEANQHINQLPGYPQWGKCRFPRITAKSFA